MHSRGFAATALLGLVWPVAYGSCCELNETCRCPVIAARGHSGRRPADVCSLAWIFVFSCWPWLSSSITAWRVKDNDNSLKNLRRRFRVYNDIQTCRSHFQLYCAFGAVFVFQFIIRQSITVYRWAQVLLPLRFLDKDASSLRDFAALYNQMISLIVSLFLQEKINIPCGLPLKMTEENLRQKVV